MCYRATDAIFPAHVIRMLAILNIHYLISSITLNTVRILCAHYCQYHQLPLELRYTSSITDSPCPFQGIGRIKQVHGSKEDERRRRTRRTRVTTRRTSREEDEERFVGCAVVSLVLGRKIKTQAPDSQALTRLFGYANPAFMRTPNRFQNNLLRLT